MTSFGDIFNFNYLRKARNAAKSSIENLKSDPDAIKKPVKYSSSSYLFCKEKKIKNAATAYADETLKIYDKEYGNGDGQTSIEEYTKAIDDITVKNTELAYGKLSDEEKQISQRMNELLAMSMDFDGDGFISKEEEAFINYMADGLDNEEGKADGTMLYAGLNEMSNAIMGLYSDSADLVEKYIMGEELSPQEQERLANTQKIIKSQVTEDAKNLGFEF